MGQNTASCLDERRRDGLSIRRVMPMKTQALERALRGAPLAEEHAAIVRSLARQGLRLFESQFVLSSSFPSPSCEDEECCERMRSRRASAIEHPKAQPRGHVSNTFALARSERALMRSCTAPLFRSSHTSDAFSRALTQGSTHTRTLHSHLQLHADPAFEAFSCHAYASQAVF